MKSQPNFSDSGSVALCVEIHKQQKIVTVASLGDSKAVIIKKTGVYEEISITHSPGNPSEKKRIEEAGGY